MIALLAAGLALLPAASPHRPDVHLWVARDVAPGKKIRIVINTANLPSIKISALPIDGDAWLSRLHKPDEFPKPIGLSIRNWSVTMGPTRSGTVQDAYYSRQVNLPFTRPGAYLLVAGGGGKTAEAVVNVTNLAVVTKRSSKRALVWVNDHKSGQIVSGASLRFYSDAGSLQAKSETGSDGAKMLALPRAAQIVLVRRGRDLAALGITAPDYDGRLNAFWQTDRPIYRPGQDVLFKSVLRLTDGQGYDVIKGRTALVTLLDPRENPVDKVELVSNDDGSIAGKLNIPQEGMLGDYTLDLLVGTQRTRKTVNVAEYRKPEFKVDVLPERSRYLAGEKLGFKLHASYYFGAPLPGAEIQWSARSGPIPFFPDSGGDVTYGGANLGPSDTYGAQPFAGEGQAMTDANGDADISFDSNKLLADSSYNLNATVIDATRRQVQASASVPVYASEIRLAVSSELDAVALGRLVPIRVYAQDLDRYPVSTQARLRIYRVVYDDKKQQNVEQELAATTISVRGGKASANLPALAEGNLIIQVTAKDRTGRKTAAWTSVWCESQDFKPEKEQVQPELTIRLNRKSYTPGDDVEAFISSNVAPHPTLVVQEGLDIWGYEVVDSSRIRYRFKTDRRFSPNAFITAATWVKQQEVTANEMIPLPDKDLELTVNLKPDKTSYEPGDRATYAVQTKDRQGRAVSADVSLSVVDEAIYALSEDTTADPYEQFWGERGNQVQSYESAPEEVSGGAYQRAAAKSPLVRQRFEDTAYWNPFIETGADGERTISFEMPGNLTTWRATARAFTPSTQVGEGSASVLATRPLTMRLALPRQFTMGDHLDVQGTVNNRTSDPVTATISLSSASLAAGSRPKQDTQVPAKGQAVVSWPVAPTEAGKVRFLGEATVPGGGPDMQDALQVDVPVVPPGYRSVQVAGAPIESSVDVPIDIPADVNPAGIKLTVRVSAGLGAEMRRNADAVINEFRYGSIAAANQLVASAALGIGDNRETIREDLALLSRSESSNGWGWWQYLPPDPVITAQVDHALSLAMFAVPDNMVRFAQSGSQQLYMSTQLWEYRALLTAGLLDMRSPFGKSAFQEVQAHGLDISPFARLRLAEALTSSDKAAAQEQLDNVLPLVSRGAVESYLPVGDGVGWTASSYRSTAELLTVLVLLDQEPTLQGQLAQWLTDSYNSSWCDSDQAAMARALGLYLQGRQKMSELGTVKLTIDGSITELTPSLVDNSASVELDNVPLKPGRNVLHFERSGSGEATVRVQVETYRPANSESHHGIRIARKFEVRNDAGIWVELNRDVKAGEPVRETLSVWGDDIPDAVKVDEPLPAGFEFVDSEVPFGMVQEEVRDGKVVHYMTNAGAPTMLRYYIRAEATGRMIASAPSAQYLRRPSVLGHGVDERLGVTAK